ncbi:NnrS protein [Teredinibacter turnerae T7901]|uniref:NnrS protein n=1 Tax=Teredinibacter turnerae (strain ATCC 39867 / T7901) TaxID=377629 RepID=C5BTD2_TERTT|nr:NnrS family protein [Teredinibacter turnerae]ACR13412.1 NnrS protein [Teredinibacter turnerae T7901]
MSDQSLSVEETIAPLWRHGFRPFFLAGSLFAIVAIGLWWLALRGQPMLQFFGGSLWWHSHELVFGFAGAIVVGFLLTAVQNWTNVRSTFGLPLQILFGCWLAARLVKGIPGAGWWVVMPEAIFYLLSTGLFARPLLVARQYKNLAIFVPLLLLMGLFATLSIAAVLREGSALRFIHAGIFVVVFMMVLMGSRVVPFFVGKAFGIPQPRPHTAVELMGSVSMFSLVALALVGFYSVPPYLLAIACLIACVFQIIKIAVWFDVRIMQRSILWSLFTAYGFIPLGLVLLACFSVGWVPLLSVPLHAFTTGAMGGLILAMAARVSLGHTGRAMQLPRFMPIALVFIFIGGLLRVLGPLLGPAYYQWGLQLSSVSWIVAFAIFVVSYLPILSAPRVDGKPG